MNRFVCGLWIALACTMIGCATQAKKEDAPDDPLGFSIRIYPAIGSPATAEKAHPLWHIWMTPVPGAINGNPAGPPFVNPTQRGAGKFTVPRARIESALGNAAKRHAGGRDFGTYDPVETQVARLGTFGMDMNNPNKRYLTGLQNPSSGHTLILIYADRACSIHTRHSELVITQPGLQWIERVEPADAGSESPEALRHYTLIKPPKDVIYRMTEGTPP